MIQPPMDTLHIGLWSLAKYFVLLNTRLRVNMHSNLGAPYSKLVKRVAFMGLSAIFRITAWSLMVNNQMKSGRQAASRSSALFVPCFVVVISKFSVLRLVSRGSPPMLYVGVLSHGCHLSSVIFICRISRPSQVSRYPVQLQPVL